MSTATAPLSAPPERAATGGQVTEVGGEMEEQRKASTPRTSQTISIPTTLSSPLRPLPQATSPPSPRTSSPPSPPTTLSPDDSTPSTTPAASPTNAHSTPYPLPASPSSPNPTSANYTHLNGSTLDAPTSSSLFPSPSSSFRPPPELETADLPARLDARIASEKSSRMTPPPSPSKPPSRPPSRPASFRHSRGSQALSVSSPVASPALRRESEASLWGSMGAKEAAVIVRDFAFEKEDPRFVGLPHPDEGKRRSEMSEQEEEEGGEGEEFSSSGGGFSWGFVTSHQTDFPAEDDSQIHSEDETAGEFVPGIYAAIYDFEPELETEMKMSTGDVVTVFSRQCAGWVQAGRIKDGELGEDVGLVPENYLQLLEQAEDEWENGVSELGEDQEPMGEEREESRGAAALGG